MSNPAFTYEIYIGAPAAKVWNGLVDGDITVQYVYGTRFTGRLRKGEPYAYVGNGDMKVVDGEILEVESGKRLAMTWNARWDDTVRKDPASRVTYELSPAGPSTKLRLVHDGFERETVTYQGSVEGWPLLLSSLKTILESGEVLPTA